MTQEIDRQAYVGCDWVAATGTLLCGDSHYGTPEEAADPRFTVKLVERYLNGEIAQPYLTKLAAIVTGQPGAELDRRTFWNNAAFCNYLPDFMDEAGEEPTPEQWASGVPWFRDTARRLRPARIVFLAERLWSAVLKNHPEMEPATPMTFDWGIWEVFTMKLDGRAIPTTRIMHPTYAGRAEFHEVVDRFVTTQTAGD